MVKRQRRTSWTLPEQEIARYTLDQGRIPLLPAGATLELNGDTQIMTLLQNNQSMVQARYAGNEIAALKYCFDAYPSYCAYDVLLAVCTGTTLKRARETIAIAQAQNTYVAVMKPVQGALLRARPKLALFGLDVRSIAGTGYMIVPLPIASPSVPSSIENGSGLLQ